MFDQNSTHTEHLLDSIDRPGKDANTVEAICERDYTPPRFLECRHEEIKYKDKALPTY